MNDVTFETNGKSNEYPLISFDEAFEIASKIKTMGGVVEAGQLAKSLNMKRGGWFALQMSALRRWGLVEGRGNLRLTALFKRIVAPQKPNDDADARLEAFLNIPFFKMLFDKYNEHGLPEDPYFMNTLRDTYGLSGRNPTLVARIVREFLTKYVPNYGQAIKMSAQPKKLEMELRPSAEDKSFNLAAPKGEFPIRISTPDATFDWDVKHELDWAVVQTAIDSIKERWKLKQRKSNDSQDTS